MVVFLILVASGALVGMSFYKQKQEREWAAECEAKAKQVLDSLKKLEFQIVELTAERDVAMERSIEEAAIADRAAEAFNVLYAEHEALKERNAAVNEELNDLRRSVFDCCQALSDGLDVILGNTLFDKDDEE